MSKIYTRLLIALTLPMLPVSGVAQEIATPPVFVRPALLREINEITRDIENMQKRNHADEHAVKDMVEQNAAMTAVVEAKKTEADHDLHLFSDSPEFQKLKDTLNSYRTQIAARDQLLADKDNEIQALRADADKMKGIIDQAVEVSQTVVEQAKSPAPAQVQDLSQSLDEKKELLAARYALLEEKSKQLQDMKEQLASLKDQLTQANARYDSVVKEYEAKIADARNADKSADLIKQLQDKEATATVLEQNLNAQNAKLESLTAALSDKDAQLARLSVIIADKDRQIVSLKEQLVQIKDENAALRAGMSKLEQAATANVITVEKDKQDDGLKNKLRAIIGERDKEIAGLKDELAVLKGVKAVPVVSAEPVKEPAQIISVTSTDSSERLNAIILEKDKQIVDLKQQLVQAKDEITGLHAALAKDDQAFAEIRERGTVLKHKIRTQAAALAAKDEFIEEYKAQLVAAKDQKENLDDLKAKLFDAEKRMQDQNAHAEDLGKELASVRQQLAQSSADAQTFKSKFSDTDKQLESVQQQLTQSSNDAQGFKAKFTDADSRVQEQNAQAANLAKELAAVQQQLAQSSSDVQNLRAKLGDAQRQTQEQSQQTAMLSKDLENKNAVLDANRERMRLWEELAIRHRQHIALLEEKSGLLSGNSGALNANIKDYQDKLSQTIAQWSLQNKDYEAKVRALQTSLDQKENDLIAANKLVEDTRADKEGIYRILDQFKARLKDMSDVTNDQAKTIAQYRAHIDQLEQDLRKAQDNAQNKQSDVDAARRNLDELKESLKNAEQEVQAKDLSLNMVQASSDDKNKINETLVAQLKQEIKSSSDELVQLRERLTVAETKLTQAEHNDAGELARVQDMLKASREELAMVNSLLKQKEDQIAQLQKGLNSNSTEFDSQNKALEAIKVSLDKQREYSAKLMDDLHWKDKQIARLKMQLKQKRVAPVRIKHVPVKVMVSNKADTVEIASLKKQLAVAEKKLQEAELNNNRPQLKEALNDAREQIATLKEKLAAAIKNQKKTVVAAPVQVKTVTVSNKADSEQIASLTAQLKDAEKKLQAAELNNNRPQLKAALNDAQEQIKTLKEKLSAMQKELSDARGEVKDKDKRINALLRQVSEQKEAITALNSKISAMQSAPKSKEDDSRLKDQIKTLQNDLQERERQIKKLQAELADKVKLLGMQHNEIEALKKELQAARAQLVRLGYTIKTIEKTTTYGPGNKGYMVKKGKDTSTMAYRVSEEVKTTETKVREAGIENVEYKVKYENAMKDLQDTQDALHKCQSTLSVQALFPSQFKKSLVAVSDDGNLVPSK